MGLASFLLFLALPQAQAGPDNAGACTAYVVESSCTNVSKTCAGLFEKEKLPKGEACGTPAKGGKWKVPESLPKACQKEAAALAERANRGELKGLCTVTPEELVGAPK